MHRVRNTKTAATATAGSGEGDGEAVSSSQPASQPACKPKAISGGASLLLLLLLQAEKAELLKGRPTPDRHGEGEMGEVRQQRRRQQAAKQPKLRNGGSGRGQRVAAAQRRQIMRHVAQSLNFRFLPPSPAASASLPSCFLCLLLLLLLPFPLPFLCATAASFGRGLEERSTEQGACSWGQLLLLLLWLLPRLEVLLDAKKTGKFSSRRRQ